MMPRKVSSKVPIVFVTIIVIIFVYAIWFPGGAVRREILFSHPKEALFSKVKDLGGGRYKLEPAPDCPDNTCTYYLCTKEQYFKFVKCSANPNPSDLTE